MGAARTVHIRTYGPSTCMRTRTRTCMSKINPPPVLEHLEETVPAALPAKPPVVSLEDKVVGVGVGFGPCEDEGDEPGAPGIHRGFEVIGGGEPAGTAAHGLLATLDQRPGSAIDDLRAT